MKFILTVIVLILIASAHTFAQVEYLPENKYVKERHIQLQAATGMHLNNDGGFLYGAEANLYYKVSDEFKLGLGLLLAKDSPENFIAPNASLVINFTDKKFSPFAKISVGPNFPSEHINSGTYFSIGGGAEYRLNENFNLTGEISYKSFSYKHTTSIYSNELSTAYFSYISPYAGIIYKF